MIAELTRAPCHQPHRHDAVVNAGLSGKEQPNVSQALKQALGLVAEEHKTAEFFAVPE